MKLKIRAILTFGLFGFCAALAQAQTAQEFVLKNGMKVVVKEDRRAPTAVQMVWYKVGSIDELNIDRIIDRIKSVTPEQVQAVAQKYFKDDNLTVAMLVPLPLDGKKPAPPPGMLH
jgi:predicted Zn-dependent peptidase